MNLCSFPTSARLFPLVSVSFDESGAPEVSQFSEKNVQVIKRALKRQGVESADEM